MTGPSDDLLRFIGSSFRSVWALELLLLLKREPRAWSGDELVSTLRASDLVVTKAIDELVAAGFLSVEGQATRYMPVSDEIDDHVHPLRGRAGAAPSARRGRRGRAARR